MPARLNEVPGGDDQADDAAVHAGVFEPGHQARQHGLGRRGAERDEQLLADVAHETPEAEPGEARHARARGPRRGRTSARSWR